MFVCKYGINRCYTRQNQTTYRYIEDNIFKVIKLLHLQDCRDGYFKVIFTHIHTSAIKVYSFLAFPCVLIINVAILIHLIREVMKGALLQK